jgi:DNA-binding response OmpR family regulator
MLSTYRVLVVEDEPAVAATIADLLTEADGIVIGPATSLVAAQKLLSEGVPFDAALLDLNLGDGNVTPVLEALAARGVPAVVYTGGEVPESVRKRHPNLIALTKPVPPARLVVELRRVMRKLPKQPD